MQKQHPTLRIQKITPGKRSSAGVWLGRFGVFLGAVIIVGVAAALGAVSYGEQYAIEKLQSVAKRAALDIDIGSVVIQPGRPIEITKIALHDPETGDLLLSVDRAITDLTLTALRNGRRRPRKVLLDGLSLHLKTPERWLTAYRHYQSSQTGGDSSQRASTALPHILFVNSTAVVQDIGQGETALLDLAGQLRPRAESASRIELSAKGALKNNTNFEINAIIDREGHNHEVGATFKPPLEIRRSNLVASLASIAISGGKVFRVSNINLASGTETISASYAQMSPTMVNERSGPNTQSMVHIHNLQANTDDLKAHASSLQLIMDPVSALEFSQPRDILLRLIEQIRSVAFSGLSLRSTSLQAKIEADYVEASMRTGSTESTTFWKRIATIRVEGSDAVAAVPSTETLALLPYYGELRALLQALPTDSVPRNEQGSQAVQGGGPAPAAVPNVMDASHLLNDLPTLIIGDSTLRITARDEDTTLFLIGGLRASIADVSNAPATYRAAISGQIQELSTGEQGTFAVSTQLTNQGSIEDARIQLSGRKLAQILAGYDERIRISQDSWLSLDVHATPHLTTDGITANGNVVVRNIGFEASRIHGSPVDGIALNADWTIDIYPEAHKIVLDIPSMTLMDAGKVRISATIEHLDRALPKIDLKLDVPEQDCRHLVGSIPPAMVPRLDGLVLQGVMKGSVSASVDLTNPRSYKHNIDIDLTQCQPAQYGRVNVSKLNDAFIHDVVEKGQSIGITVGPGTWHYRALHRIPEHVQMGALATEDHSFFKHEGFRPSLIRRAVVMNLEGGRYVYGGSTITQQLVKNLFLSREKTLTRKLEEAIIVWMVENAISKKRILELYLNCIEYGPNLYGLENASRAYFGKPVEELNALEGAFLMGLKPYPWAGWKQFERGYVKPWWHTRLKKILTGMAKSGWITQEQLDASKSWEPIFLTSKHRIATPPQKMAEERIMEPTSRPRDRLEPDITVEQRALPEAPPLRERTDTPMDVDRNLDPDEPPEMPNDTPDEVPENI
ncbi:MAG: biosynthetic peptidoglycan transglycosylase [Myxococcota bacterium]|nr:biosynthetic peptidoglycan transglycosylase [Myxococcota bacterium]